MMNDSHIEPLDVTNMTISASLKKGTQGKRFTNSKESPYSYVTLDNLTKDVKMAFSELRDLLDNYAKMNVQENIPVDKMYSTGATRERKNDQSDEWQSLGRMVCGSSEKDSLISAQLSTTLIDTMNLMYTEDVTPTSYYLNGGMPVSVRNIRSERKLAAGGRLEPCVRGNGMYASCVSKGGCSCFQPPSLPGVVLTSQGRDQLLLNGFKDDITSPFVTPGMLEHLTLAGVPLRVAIDEEASIGDILSFSEPTTARAGKEMTQWLPFTLIGYFLAFMRWMLALNGGAFGVDHAFHTTFIARGGEYMIQAVLIQACEWLAVNAKSGRTVDEFVIGSTKKPRFTGVLARDLIAAWLREDVNFVLPSFLWNLRSGRRIDYVKSADWGGAAEGSTMFEVGLDELVKQQFFKEGLRLVKSKSAAEKMRVKELRLEVGEKFLKERSMIAFVESIGKGTHLTNSAMTTGSIRRTYQCLSHLVFQSNYADIYKMDDVVRGSFRTLSLRPGTNAKTVNKAVFWWARVFTALARRVHGVPTSGLQLTRGPMADILTADCDTEDVHTYTLLRGVLDKDWLKRTDWDEVVTESMWEDLLEMALEAKTPVALQEPLRAIYHSHGTNAISANATDSLRIIAYGLGAGSHDGFQYSTACALTTTSFASDIAKEHTEGRTINGVWVALDPKRVPDDANYQTAFYNDAVDDMMRTPMTMTRLANGIPQILTNSSGGADNIVGSVEVSSLFNPPVDGKRPAKGASAVGHTGDMKVRFKSNIKSLTMPLLASFLLPPDINAFYTERIAQQLSDNPMAFVSFGSRNTAGKWVRPVYNVSVVDQVLQVPLYESIKKLQKDMTLDLKGDSRFGFQPFVSTGVGAHDYLQMIYASVQGAWDKRVLTAGIDASALDQHILPVDRMLLIKSILRYANGSDGLVTGADGSKPQPASFCEILSNVFILRNEWYFSVRIDGAPDQIVKVSTMPSGDLLTTVLNGVKTMAMQQLTLDTPIQLPSTGLSTRIGLLAGTKVYIQGDDVSLTITLDPTDTNTVIEEWSDIGLRCNNILETSSKSWSGSNISHFLQLLFYCGQEIPRHMALSHENPVVYDVTMLGSLIDKVVKMCDRGGNQQTSTMLISMLLMLGSTEKVFGTRFTHSVSTLIQPGGVVNRVFVGSPSPNSALWLLANGPELGLDQPMRKRPAPQSDYSLGSDINEANGDIPIEGTVNGVTVAKTDAQAIADGTTTTMMASELLSSSQKILTRPVVKNTSALGEATVKALVTAGQVDIPPRYFMSNMTEGLYLSSLGSYMKNKSNMTRQFKKLDQIRAGREDDEGVIPNPRALFPIIIASSRVQVEVTFDQDTVITFDGDVFVIYVNRQPVRRIAARYTPFWIKGGAASLLTRLFGVSSERGRIGNRRDLLAKLGVPGRPDVRGDDVADVLLRNDPAYRPLIAQAMGFTESEYGAISGMLDQVPILKTIAEGAEYSSQTDAVRSVDPATVRQFMQEFSMVGLEIEDLTPATQEVVLSNFMNVLYEEINVFTVFNVNMSDRQRLVARVPRLSLI
jgi:hypothetical protein